MRHRARRLAVGKASEELEGSGVQQGALDLDPWGVLASGTLLAGFPSSTAESACDNLNAAGFPATVIGTAGSGSGVQFSDGTDLVQFERDELSRLNQG